MLTLPSDVATDVRPGYRPYRATVAGIESLSPHFTKVTFTGDDFGTFGTAGLDQRIKILLPLPGVGICGPDTATAAACAEGAWYATGSRSPTPCAVPSARTRCAPSDHGCVRSMSSSSCTATRDPRPGGSRDVTVGDALVMIGPDARSPSSGVGLDWHPGPATNLLLAGDETAVPAICSILESLPQGRGAWAFLEVPSMADALHVRLPPHCEIAWLARGDAVRGTPLVAAVREWVDRNRALLSPGGIMGAAPVLFFPVPAPSDADADADVDPVADADADADAKVDPVADDDLLWDSPQSPDGGDFYAWLAGEAGVIKTLRRLLVNETGLDRSRVAFMGYWRQGKPEAQ